MSTVVPIVRLKRILPKEMAQEHSLFLAKKAFAVAPDSPALRETLEQLTRSDNAAVANAAFEMLGPLRMIK